MNTFKSNKNFYDENQINFFTCSRMSTCINNNGVEKKIKPSDLPPWGKFIKPEDFKKHQEQLGTLCIKTGAISGITVIDFDCLIAYNKLIDVYPELLNNHIVKTKNGFHMYFKYDKKFKTSTNCFKDYEGVDIRNDESIVFAPPTNYETIDGSLIIYKSNGKAIETIPEFMFELLKDERKGIITEKKTQKKTQKKNDINKKIIINEDDEMNIHDLIDVKYIDDFDTWNRIVWAMKNEGYDEETIKNFSKRSDKYSDSGFQNAYDKSPSNITLSQGTINYYAKLSNSEKYYEMTASNFDYDFTDDGLSKILLKNIGEEFIYMNRLLHVYENKNWKIKNGITICKDYLIDYFNKIKKHTNDTEKLYLINDTIKKIKTLKHLKYIYEMFLNELENRNDTVEFNTSKPNILCFNNTAINIITGEHYEVKKDDYITFNTHYNYVKSTDEDLTYMGDRLNEIFPNIEIKKCWLSFAFSCLSANRPEKLFICTGKGRNGKSYLHDLLMSALGTDYFHKGKVTTITQKQNDGGSANVDLQKCDKKRMTLYCEPDAHSSFSMGIIKEMTGGNTISARGLYSSKTECIMNHTMGVECNDIPSITGTIDKSIIERVIIILFEALFTDDEKELNDNINAHPLNIKLKTDENIKKYRNVLIDYLIKYAPKEIYVPDVVKNNTKQYLEQNNNLLQWFEDSYEENEAAFVKLTELYESYKTSEQYINLPKNQKAKYIFKTFKDNILKTKLKDNYHAVKTVNKKTYRNIIIGYSENNNYVEM